MDSDLDGIFDMEDATKVVMQKDRVVKIGKELVDFNLRRLRGLKPIRPS